MLNSSFIKNIGFIYIVFILFSCKKDKNNVVSPPESSVDIVKGKVVLPANNTIDPNSLTVMSLFDEVHLNNSNYEIDGRNIAKYSTQFVVNQSGDIMLMKYTYPGISNNDITSESTALAMLMNLTAIQSLSDEGKLNIINNITSNVEFKLLVAEIDKSLISNKSFCDSLSNSSLRKAFGNLINTIATIRLSNANTNKMATMSIDNRSQKNTSNSGNGIMAAESVTSAPISFYRTGRQVTIVNNGIACSYVGGVYKDGKKVGTSFTIDGLQFSPSSVFELSKGNFGTAEPISKTIDLEGDGNFEIRLRSGKSSDDSEEAKQAFYENLLKFALDQYKFIVDVLPGKCKKTMLARIMDNVTGIPNIPSNSTLAGVSRVFHDVNITLASTIEDVAENCYDEDIIKKANKYIKTFSKYLFFVKWVDFIGGTVNANARLYHFFATEGSIDRCYKASGNNVGDCNVPILTTSEATSISAGSAICGTAIIFNGGTPITTKGVCWGTSQNPELTNSMGKTNEGTGSEAFVSTMTNLSPNTKYFARAYATGSFGTAYGNQVSFKTTDKAVGEVAISDPFIGMVYIGGQLKYNYGSYTTYACKMKISKSIWTYGHIRPKIGGSMIWDYTFELLNRTEDANYYYYDVIQYCGGGGGISVTFQIVVYSADYKSIGFESNVVSAVIPDYVTPPFPRRDIVGY